MGQSLDSLLENGMLVGELCEFYENFEETCNKLSKNNVIYMDNFLSAAYAESLPPQQLLSVTVKQLPSYGGSLDPAVGDMQHYANSGFGTLVLCGSRHRGRARLLEAMESRGVKGSLAFPLNTLPQPGQILLAEGSLAAGMRIPFFEAGHSHRGTNHRTTDEKASPQAKKGRHEPPKAILFYRFVPGRSGGSRSPPELAESAACRTK